MTEIKAVLQLKPGPMPESAIEYANILADIAQTNPAYSDIPNLALPRPLCAVFVNLKRWQVED